MAEVCKIKKILTINKDHHIKNKAFKSIVKVYIGADDYVQNPSLWKEAVL